MNKQAFTLIELLVVISIIGLLSSVVLASLNSARTKGQDSAVKAGMKQMHSQAQTYLDANNLAVFGTAANCSTGLFNDTRFNQIISNIQTNSGSTAVCASLGANWAVSLPSLKGGGSWCTDNSQGWFKAGTAQTSGALQGMCQ
jgi:prepilin-type N-terminal cleavage/methylation domain-containing protein